ncbi:MAG TPA: cysteine peptidase family C39 domain-containing protein [Polyangiaceae bacterium]
MAFHVDSRTVELLLPALAAAIATHGVVQLTLTKWRSRLWTVRVVAILLGLPWLVHVVYYTHLFDKPWFYEVRALPGMTTAVGLVAGIVASFLEAKSLNRPLQITFSSALVLLALAKPSLVLLPTANLENRWKDGVCLQTSGASCGACATASVLRALGQHSTEAEVAYQSYTTSSGTHNWHLTSYIRSIGLDVRFHAPETIAEVVPPAIIGVRLDGGVGHFLAFLGWDGNRVVIGEPLVGRLVLTPDEFRKKYEFAQFAMEVSKS